MSLTSTILDYIKATKYNIGFIDGDLKSVLEGRPIKVNWLKHKYKDRWFADPFILDVTDNEIIVFVEEWYDPIKRGRITKLIIDKRTFELKSLKVMLESDSHLSFPAIDRRTDGIFIHPENSAKNCLQEYKYNPQKDIFEETDIISMLPLTDSSCNNFFGKDYMFSTKLPDANGKELGIYTRNAIEKEYKLQESHLFNENISRMAGNFFEFEGKIYRPAQVCIKSYGDAVSIQEVSYKEGEWKFHEIRRIYSPNHNLDLGFHTFNVYKDVIVVDAVGYRRSKLCHFLKSIKHL